MHIARYVLFVGIRIYRCQGVRGKDCYQCFAGELCQEEQDLTDCLLQSLRGDPEVLAEYWTSGLSQIPCLQTPADYRYIYKCLCVVCAIEK